MKNRVLANAKVQIMDYCLSKAKIL